MADVEFQKVQDSPALYELHIGGVLQGEKLTMEQVIQKICEDDGKQIWLRPAKDASIGNL